MILNTMSPTVLLLGAAAIGAALFALQRLRTRYRKVDVPTVMFWKEAVEESQARVLVRRFRHPWAYALILTLSLIMWFLFSDPQLESGKSGVRDVYVLNATASALVGNDFQKSKDLLIDELAHAGRGHCEVFVLDTMPHLVLGPEESPLLLEERLAELKPQAVPQRILPFLDRMEAGAIHDGVTHVRLVGFPQLKREHLAKSRFRVTHMDSVRPHNELNRSGLRSIGASVPRSGLAFAVDVLIVAASENDSDVALKVTLDGDPLAVEIEKTGKNTFVLRDLPANGKELLVRLGQPDALSADNEARFILPTLSPIAVTLDQSLDETLRLFLLADPFVDCTATPADVQVGGKRDTGLPGIMIAPQARDFSIEVAHARELTWVEDQLFGGIDLNTVATLAGESAPKVHVSLSVDGVRRLVFPASLLSEGREFVARREFPVLLDRVLLWLSGRPSPIFMARIGSRFSQRDGPWKDSQGQLMRAAGLDPRALSPGVITSGSGAKQVLSYFGEDALLPSEGATDISVSAASAAANGQIFMWLGLLLLALLAFEWHLVRTSRIP